ncbi:DNA-binding domain-containing protein [Aquabacterium sp.]|uniref:DNA-binding domain-containing protein n=1 Tax=Aquabacterium sp. TaxID=1872578 RepID=UPI002C7D4891|nr:DNA-binding domain-containing protein [Aquabacterium sp.]HSW05834.1 DNA-binding domain-containing protein [Aquabacterium sp.]
MSSDTEAQRQQLLLRVLWRDVPDTALGGWLRDAPPRAARGLSAYRSNGEALAARALAASFPTVAELIGDDSFAALARAYWRRHPPTCGDMAAYGDGLAEFIAADEQLADEACLADCARLDWAVHRTEAAADAHPPPEGLALLGSEDPAALAMVLRPGLVLLSSRWPVATIWLAHRSGGPERFAPVREAFAEQRAEHALVWREGWRPRVSALAEAEARFMRALLDARPLAAALDGAGADFVFEPWLLQALQQGWLAAVLPCLDHSVGDER